MLNLLTNYNSIINMIFQHIMVVLPHLVSVHTMVSKPKVENSPPQSLTISLLILHKAGWCHSVFEFKTMCRLLLMWTPSLTCLDRQSMNLPVTVAENTTIYLLFNY